MQCVPVAVHRVDSKPEWLAMSTVWLALWPVGKNIKSRARISVCGRAFAQQGVMDICSCMHLFGQFFERYPLQRLSVAGALPQGPQPWIEISASVKICIRGCGLAGPSVSVSVICL